MAETSIKITDSGKIAMDGLYEQRGIKKIQLVSRAMEWVAAQDKTLQSIILGQADPVDALEILELIRRRLETEAMDINPAAQIVDDTVNVAGVPKRKPGQPAPPKEA